MTARSSWCPTGVKGGTKGLKKHPEATRAFLLSLRRTLNSARIKANSRCSFAYVTLSLKDLPNRQRCWAHKTRNILNYVKRADQDEVKKDLHRISQTRNLRIAQQAAQRFVQRWDKLYPQATQCLKADLPDLLTFLQVIISLPSVALRTTPDSHWDYRTTVPRSAKENQTHESIQ